MINEKQKGTVTCVKRQTPKEWAAQFGHSEESYALELEQARLEALDQARLEFWASMVNTYRITSAKQWMKTVDRLLWRHRLCPKPNSFYQLLLRFGGYSHEA